MQIDVSFFFSLANTTVIGLMVYAPVIFSVMSVEFYFLPDLNQYQVDDNVSCTTRRVCMGVWYSLFAFG